MLPLPPLTLFSNGQLAHGRLLGLPVLLPGLRPPRLLPGACSRLLLALLLSVGGGTSGWLVGPDWLAATLAQSP